MNSNIQQQYENFLNPTLMRSRLITASIYISGFELLKNSIVDHIRYFFWRGFDESGEKYDPRYQAEVLARNKSPIYASFEWLKEMKVIDDADIQTFERVKTCRNTLAHNLLSVLSSDGMPNDYKICFADMVALLKKIEMWWIINFEIPINEEFDNEKIDEDGIVPGPVMGIQLLCDIALGDEEKSRFYYDEFRKRTTSTQKPP